MSGQGVTSVPVLGIDIDGTVDESLDFFRTMTAVWPGRVVVITLRTDGEEVLRKFGVRFDSVISVKRLEDKPEVMVREGVSVFFGDQDEEMCRAPMGVTVFKIRNPGNFDEGTNRWLYSPKTGKVVGFKPPAPPPPGLKSGRSLAGDPR